MVSPLVKGYTSGTGTGTDTDAYLKNEGSITLKLSGAGRVATKPINGIRLDGADQLYLIYEGFEFDTDADIGILLYNKENPASVTDGRVALSAGSVVGRGIVTLDVTSYTGVYYPQLMLSNFVDDGGASHARVMEFGLLSSSVATSEPSEPGVAHSLYKRGNENPYASNGWQTGYNDGAGTRSFNEDAIVITANGSSASSRQAITSGLVDLTGVSVVEAIVDVSITDDAESDCGLAIYSTNTPSSPTNGRVTFEYNKYQGVHKATIDVRSLSGTYYVFFFCSANTLGGAPSVVTAKVLDVRMY